jgi:hypothetical protein
VVTHTWINDYATEEPLDARGGGVQPKANYPWSSHARERASSWCHETMVDLAHAYERTLSRSSNYGTLSHTGVLVRV